MLRGVTMQLFGALEMQAYRLVGRWLLRHAGTSKRRAVLAMMQAEPSALALTPGGTAMSQSIEFVRQIVKLPPCSKEPKASSSLPHLDHLRLNVCVNQQRVKHYRTPICRHPRQIDALSQRVLHPLAAAAFLAGDPAATS
jgi:hypothetical protein